MSCPMFIDYVRECYTKIGYMPQDSYDYCTSDTYVECPFYKKINSIGISCENIDKCPIFKKFGMGNFKNFVKITKEYCLSENRTQCARYKMKMSGQTPPPDLLPDGSKLEEQEKKT